MIRSLRAILLALAALVTPVGLPAQEAPPRIDHGKTDAKLKGYTTPEGFKLELVATPALANPVALTFDREGTPVVLEHAPGKVAVKADAVTITYADKSTRKIAVAARAGADSVKMLEATKADVFWDKTNLFSNQPGIDAILPWGEWLYLATPGHLERVSTIRKEKEKIAPQPIVRGLGHLPHGVTGMAFGPDGWLYIAVGAGDHHLQGSDGTKVTLLATGAILRCKADGAGLMVVARGLSQPTAPSWDSVGHAFFTDREERGGRVLHLLDGSDHGFVLNARPSPVPEAIRKEKFEPLPPSAPTMLRAGGSQPTAILSPIETRWPGHFRALLLVADAGRQAIVALSLDREGATFSLEKSFDLLKCEDRDFAPKALSVGPDGALYILDGRAEGRLLRLSWVGSGPEEALALRPRDTWAKLLKASEDDLLAALATPEASDRRIAAEELARREGKQLPALLKLVKGEDEPLLARLAALSAALPKWNAEVRATCLGLLNNRSNDLRRQAALALFLHAAPADAGAQTLLLFALNDADGTVRRAVVLAMGRIAAEGAPDALVNALIFDDSRDPAYRQGLASAIERLGKPGIDRLLSVGDSGVDAEIFRIVQVFTTLQSRLAAEALPKLLQNPHLNERQRGTLLRTLPRYRFEPALDLESVAAHFEAMPEEPVEVKLAALEALAQSAPVAGPKLTTWLPGLLKEKDANLRRATLATLVVLKPAKLAEPLAALASQATTEADERALALWALAQIDRPEAVRLGKALAADAKTKTLAELKKLAGAADFVGEVEK